MYTCALASNCPHAPAALASMLEGTAPPPDGHLVVVGWDEDQISLFDRITLVRVLTHAGWPFNTDVTLVTRENYSPS